MKIFRSLGIATLVLLAWAGMASAQEPFAKGTWTALKRKPPSAVGHMLLLTDGSVLVNSYVLSGTDNWYRLVPDHTGSYINGTWHNAGSLPPGYNPLYFASAVLKNGKVVVMGGEYNNNVAVWTTMGALYNPITNSWSSLAAPASWSTIGDASSVVLPNGRFMLANCCTTDEALLTLSGSTATWTPTGAGKFDSNDEEGWTLLPNGNVLAVDAYVGSYDPSGKNSEIYNTNTGTWSSAGSIVAQLWDSCPTGQYEPSYELGPAVLRPNGTVFYTGANGCGAGHTAIYHTGTKTWTAGPDFPNALDIADGPAALLPNGNVLLDTSPGIFNNGSKFFEWNGTALQPTSAPPNAPIDSSYVGNMVVLPTGQVMFTDFSSSVEIYTPAGAPCAGCAPTITSVAATLTHGGSGNVIKGAQFNGMSQGAAYGDDSQSATNYPLVRITDSTGGVWYCRTRNFSTMGVHTGATIVSALFDIPSGITLGSATLVVVANGIPSAAVAVTII